MDLGFAVNDAVDWDWDEKDTSMTTNGKENCKPTDGNNGNSNNGSNANGPYEVLYSSDSAGASSSKAGGAGGGGGPVRPAGRMHQDDRTRYFIIKCNSHKNLVSSIQFNVWATQKHNEKKLNEGKNQYVSSNELIIT